MSGASIDLVDQVWPGLMGQDESGPFLVGGRCGACGAISFGQREICARCWSSQGMEMTPIGRTGRLYSSTMVHQAPDGFEGPYLVGYVDLPEGVRAFAHIDKGDARPAIGDEVVLRSAPLRKAGDGRTLTGPLYASVRAHGSGA